MNIIGQFDLFRFELLMRRESLRTRAQPEISVVLPRMLQTADVKVDD